MKKLIESFNAASKFALWIVIFFALVIMGTLVVLAFIKICQALFLYNDPLTFLPALLHGFEYLFAAPIPLIILFSFVDYLFRVFPKIDVTVAGSTMDSLLAEKVFVSSIIGVTSTFIIAKLIELYNQKAAIQPSQNNLILLALLFLAIEITFFMIISKHRSGDKRDNKT
jgi:hypothetical protein